MGNLLNTIKKFLGNKNTVTILGVLVGVVVLWGFYSYRVSQATTPTKVPYAKNVLNATDVISEDDIEMVEINQKFLKKASVITKKSDLVGKCITTGTSIPEGGLFYDAQVVDCDDLPNTIFDNMEDGNTAFSLSVNNHTTFGNSIYPGDKIDLFLKVTDETNKIVYGKFVEGATVLAVRDSSGNNVFSLGSTKTPAELIFQLSDEDYKLLKKAEYLNLEIVPAVRNKNYSEDGGEMVLKDYFVNYINSKTAQEG